MWDAGLDYDHGTGHGVGSYLSVHEGPVSISRAARLVPIEAGMILSNEPGFYAPGAVRHPPGNAAAGAAGGPAWAARPFLRFEVLSLAPFDRRLIEPSLLTPAELAWLDSLSCRVADEVLATGAADLGGWLAKSCARLVAFRSRIKRLQRVAVSRVHRVNTLRVRVCIVRLWQRGVVMLGGLELGP